MSVTPQRSAPRAKEFHFPASIEWIEARRVTARVAGKRPIDVSPPPVFSGVDPEAWSPEDFFVAAAASCLAVTYTGLAQRAGIALRRCSVDADGVAGRRPDGRFGFTRITLRLHVVTDSDALDRARELAQQAEETCLVAVSLDLPVQVETEILADA